MTDLVPFTTGKEEIRLNGSKKPGRFNQLIDIIDILDIKGYGYSPG